MSANMSILGLYGYDNTLFDEMSLPEEVDRQTLINNILMECSELEILYPDPNFMKLALNTWSAKQIVTWSSLAKTFELEYNPLYNVDAHEILTEERDLRSTNAGTNSNTETGTNTESGTNTHQVNGFNEAGLKDSEKDIASNTLNTSVTNSGTISNTGTDTGTVTTTNRRYGNIGVTKSTDLVDAELEVRPKLNIYNYIIEDFKKRFTLLIY